LVERTLVWLQEGRAISNAGDRKPSTNSGFIQLVCDLLW
jgi:hypothetical protein